MELDEAGYVLAGETTKTNLPGVFAVGDLRKKPLRQVVTAASDGAVAAHFIEEYFSTTVKRTDKKRAAPRRGGPFCVLASTPKLADVTHYPAIGENKEGVCQKPGHGAGKAGQQKAKPGHQEQPKSPRAIISNTPANMASLL